MSQCHTDSFLEIGWHEVIIYACIDTKTYSALIVVLQKTITGLCNGQLVSSFTNMNPVDLKGKNV